MRQWMTTVEKWGLLLFLATFSFQTRLVVARWAPLSFGPFLIGNVRPFSEWMSGFVYASDIVLVGLLVLWVIRRRLYWWRKEDYLLVSLFGLACVSVAHAINIPVALFRVAKLFECLMLFWYFRDVVKGISLQSAGIAVIAGGFVQTVIAIAQSVLGKSIGLRLLGESPLSLTISNVAVFVVNGTKYLRAYGAMPHPNVLAVFLYVVSLLIVVLFFYNIYPNTLIRRTVMVVYPFVLWALFLTYSRTILAVWCLVMSAMAIWLWGMHKKLSLSEIKRAQMLWVVTLIISSMFVISHWTQVQSRIHVDLKEEAVTERVFYNKVAGQATEAKPLLGLGMGQFVPHLIATYPNYPISLYQPVHNMYLLISSELGVVGLVVFLAFVTQLLWRYLKVIRNNKEFGHWLVLGATVGLLLMGCLDHFLWTLQQGSFLMWIMFAIMASLLDFRRYMAK